MHLSTSAFAKPNRHIYTYIYIYMGNTCIVHLLPGAVPFCSVPKSGWWSFILLQPSSDVKLQE